MDELEKINEKNDNQIFGSDSRWEDHSRCVDFLTEYPLRLPNDRSEDLYAR